MPKVKHQSFHKLQCSRRKMCQNWQNHSAARCQT